jgi:hypothetical protein
MRQKVCQTCGSDDVWLDANAVWSPEDDCWELLNVFDAAWCNACDGECTIIDKEMEAA